MEDDVDKGSGHHDVGDPFRYEVIQVEEEFFLSNVVKPVNVRDCQAGQNQHAERGEADLDQDSMAA